MSAHSRQGKGDRSRVPTHNDSPRGSNESGSESDVYDCLFVVMLVLISVQ